MRRRLTLLVAATTLLVLLAFFTPLAVLIRSLAEERAVGAATRDLQALVPLVATADRDTVGLSVGQAMADSPYPITVFFPDGAIVGAAAARSPAVELAARGRSFSVRTAAGREVVIAIQGPDGTAVLRTFASEAELTGGVGRAWLLLSVLGLSLVVVGVIVADQLARALVRPITELSAVSGRLAGGDLAARVEPAGPPEVRAVGSALNHLAGRIQQLIDQERETHADLSHRLRTPLTALRLEVEALGATPVAARLTAGVDAVERAVTGLIWQARGRVGASASGCDAVAVVRERVAFWGVLAEDTDRRVTMWVADGPVPVGLAADELAAALDALLGNIFAHTDDGTPFVVALEPRAGGGADITVADEGPGLPGDGIGAVRRGASGGASTGLGLDIARRAALASGGALHLGGRDDGRPGAQIRLELGPPRADGS